jgi:sulfate transport system ATP-binding protein
VADEIVIINEGRIEQVGTPDQLYDEPANDFVMRFVGPVTSVRGELVRPHDLGLEDVDPGPGVDGVVAGVVRRLVRVGFEVRVEVAVGDEVVLVTLSRSQLADLDVREGSDVWITMPWCTSRRRRSTRPVPC